MERRPLGKGKDADYNKMMMMKLKYNEILAINSTIYNDLHQIRISFKWQDAFDKETFFGGKKTLSKF